MKIQKRYCGIKIKFYDLGAGWANIKLEIDGKVIDFCSSDILGDGIENLVNAIFSLNPKLYGIYDNDYKNINYLDTPIKDKEGREWIDVPISAELSFDEEGSFINMKFEREKTLDIDCNLKIQIIISREEESSYNFTVRYKDFCYALAKACTEMFKEYGFIGYWKSYWRRGFSLRQLLEIKAIALDNYDYIKTIFDNNSEKSNINKEIEFLLLDM